MIEGWMRFSEKRSLTRSGSSRLTLHLTWSIADSGIRYEAGDACGIIPHNDPALVEDILRALHFSGQERVEFPKVGTLTLHEALRHHFVITRLQQENDRTLRHGRPVQNPPRPACSGAAGAPGEV
jgi:sulfite reductase alpha subunit-like flavoprotein